MSQSRSLKLNILAAETQDFIDEILIALAMTSVANENAKKALEQIPDLKGCQVHTSVMLSEADTKTFNRLGVNLTSEPVRSSSKLY